MKRMLKHALLLVLAAGVGAGLTGCTAEAKRKRHLSRAEAYFQKNDFKKAEIEYLNVGRLSKTPDPLVVKRLGTIYHAQGRSFEAYQVLAKAKEMNQEDLESRYLLGTVLTTLQRPGAAREEALFVLGKKPDHAGAAMLLADTSVSAEHVASAREKLNGMIAGNANTWAAHAALAALYLRESKIPEAEKEAEAAAQLNATAPEVKVLKGRLAALQNQGDKAAALLREAGTSAPAHSPAKLELAILKIKNNETAEAKKLLDELLKETPDFMPAWTLRGRLALGENDFAEVDRIAQTVLSWNPRSYDIRILKARALVMKQEPAKALLEFAQLDSLYPNIPEVKYETAVAHVQNGAMEEALKSLDAALQANAGYAPAILLRAELKMRAGGVGESITAMLAFLKAYPDNAQAKMILANSYVAMNQLDQAAILYDELAKQFPKQPELPAYIGFIQFRQGKFDEARKSYEESLKINPLYVAAAENLIDLDIAQKNLGEAQRRANEQLALHTNAPAALMLAAKVALAKGETNNATRLLKEVALKAPEASGLYTLLAQLESASGDTKGAVEQYKSAVKANPSDVTSQLQLGMAYDALGDFANARKQYETVVKMNPRVALAWNNLAYVLAERFNEIEPAVTAALKARELQPSDPDTADTLGWIHFRKGEYPQALNLLREAAGGRPNVAEVVYHLARAEYVMGLEDAARASFKKVISLKGASTLLKDSEQRLAVLEATPDAQSIATLEMAVKNDPTDYLAVFRLGQAHEAAANFDKAATAYESATKLNPSVTAPLQKMAVLYSDKLTNNVRALEAARAARKLAPNDPAVAGVLGKLSYRSGDYSGAVALLQENARSSAPDADSLYDLAVAQYCLAQFEQSRSALADYLKRGSVARAAEARDLQQLLDFTEGRGNAEAAQKAAATRLARDTADLPGLMTIGLALEQGGKVEEAGQQYEKVLALNKSFSPAQRQLAILYSGALANDEKAVELGSKARQVFDRDAVLAKALGKAAYRKGDYRQASTALTQVTTETPNDAEAFLLLGLTYEKLEKPASARQALDSAVKAAPGSSHAEEATKALQRLK
jgi:tetratricopeptide (TPR) repeat protein